MLLVDILEQKISPSQDILSLGHTQSITRNTLQYRKIHDIFALMMLHQEYCSKELGRVRKKEILSLAKRSKKHIEYYSNNSKLTEIYVNLVKILVKTHKK